MDWLECSALDMAAAIRRGEISSTELLNLQIARLERVNPVLNGLAVDRFEAARAEARAADERLGQTKNRDNLPPFLGVPCTIKEFLGCTGMPQTSGLIARKDYVAQEDATVVTRLKDAGAVIMGSTNVPEGGLWMETHNLIYGRTNNPWNIKHTPGGSSGGEGALIAAGASPIGLGSDVGGSIRIPSAFCGIPGHKPTGGLVPNTGQYPRTSGAAGRFLVTGPMGRRIGDLTAMLRVIAGPDGIDESCASMEWELPGPLDLRDVTVLPIPSPGGLRIRPEMQAAVVDAARVLEARGARIVERKFAGLKRGFQIWAGTLSEASDESYDTILGGGEPTPIITELFKVPFGRSRHSYPAALIGSVEKITHRFAKGLAKYVETGQALQAELEEALGPRGILLYPPYSRPAPRHHWAFATPFDAACTALFNIMEFPVTQCPIRLSKKGLPIGVQVIGARGQDGLTLAVSEALEAEFGGWRIARISD